MEGAFRFAKVTLTSKVPSYDGSVERLILNPRGLAEPALGGGATGTYEVRVPVDFPRYDVRLKKMGVQDFGIVAFVDVSRTDKSLPGAEKPSETLPESRGKLKSTLLSLLSEKDGFFVGSGFRANFMSFPLKVDIYRSGSGGQTGGADDGWRYKFGLGNDWSI